MIEANHFDVNELATEPKRRHQKQFLPLDTAALWRKSLEIAQQYKYSIDLDLDLFKL